MHPKNRARMLWIFVSLTSLYALANVVVFYFTNTYGPAWLVTSILVYAALFVGSIYLALIDSGYETTTLAPALWASVPNLAPSKAAGAWKRREVIYESNGYQVVREVTSAGLGEDVDLYVLTPDAGPKWITDIERGTDAAFHASAQAQVGEPAKKSPPRNPPLPSEAAKAVPKASPVRSLSPKAVPGGAE